MHVLKPFVLFALYAGQALSQKSTIRVTITSTTTVTPAGDSNAIPTEPAPGKSAVGTTLTSNTTVTPTLPVVPFGNSTPQASLPAAVPSSAQENKISANHTINTVIDKQYCVLICPSTFPTSSTLPTLVSNTTSLSGGGIIDADQKSSSALVPSTPTPSLASASTPVPAATIPQSSSTASEPTSGNLTSSKTMNKSVKTSNNGIESSAPPAKSTSSGEEDSGSDTDDSSGGTQKENLEDDDTVGKESQEAGDDVSKDASDDNDSETDEGLTSLITSRHLDGILSTLLASTGKTATPTKSISDPGKGYMEPGKDVKHDGTGNDRDLGARMAESDAEGRGMRRLKYPRHNVIRWLIEHVG